MRFYDRNEKYLDRVIIETDKGKIYTYKDLDKIHDIIKNNTKKRETVFLICKKCPASILAFLSFLRNEVIVFMLDDKIDNDVIKQLIDSYEPNYIFVNNNNIDAYKNFKEVLNIENMVLIKNENQKLPIKNNKLAFLISTSGSTGSPKFVKITYNGFDSALRKVNERIGYNENDICISILPLQYIYGLELLCCIIKVGGKILVTEKSVVQNSFWELCENVNPTVFYGVPYMYENLESLGILDNISRFRIASVAGGKLSDKLMKKISQNCADNNVLFYNEYGQTESGGAISISIKSNKGWYKLENCIGESLPGGKIYLTEECKIEGEKVEGELVFESERVSLGYALEYEDLNKDDEFKGILHTGDIAQRDKEGNIVIVGRAKRFIKLYGKRYSLDHIESCLKDYFPSNGFAVVGKDEFLVVFYTGEKKCEEVEKYIKKKLRLSPNNYRVEYRENIPTNSNGKINYKELLEFINELYEQEHK